MSFLRDPAYSARSFARTPVLTLALLLSIALGIGSNAAVLGFVRGLVVRDVPLPGVESLVSLYARGERDAFVPLSYTRYLAVKGAGVFEILGAVRESPMSIGVANSSTVAVVAQVTPRDWRAPAAPSPGASSSPERWHWPVCPTGAHVRSCASAVAAPSWPSPEPRRSGSRGSTAAALSICGRRSTRAS